ncbi:MAG: inositol monophosphatase family protein [Anaerolineales bacterium]
MNIPVLADLEQIALQAGQILSDGYEKIHQVKFKGEIDPVTEIDQRSETFILAEIQRRFPGHQILAEESGATAGSAEHLWIVDPLDGTVNYAHGVPVFSVSIAYAFRGEIRLGAVLDPLRGELFRAEAGRGAWNNARPLKVSSAAELGRSLLTTGFPYDIRTTSANNLETFARLSLQTQGVRRLGSAALDLCYVAAGRFDGYWERFLRPWDLAAGSLIAREAGARVTCLDGSTDFLQEPLSVIAANPALYPHLLREVTQQM